MKTTMEMHLHASKSGDGWELFATDMTAYGYAYVGPVEVTFEAPEDFDVNAAKVKTLREQETELRADFQARITQIHREISELTAIRNEVAA